MEGLLSRAFYGNTVLEWAIAFGDSAMNIIFYYIKKAADILGTQTAMNMGILAEFTRAGLDFAFPTRTLYTKQLT
jgi:MscS family membrane protein